MNVEPKCTATAIGSLPHPNVEQALDVIWKALPNAPIWPQLPKRDLREQMEIQYSEGLPRVVIDEAKARMYIDTSGDYSEDLAKFYEGYMRAEETGDCSAGAISPEFSVGIGALERRLKSLGRKLPFVKCQTTGPLSFALTIVDENKRAIYYNEEFVDTVIKGLALKCRWQIQKLKAHGNNIICFVDEPILSAFGSSTYVSIQREDVITKLGEVIDAVHKEGALAGVHCCGNTDWSLLVDAGADIVNFDAFQYGETVALYPEHMKRLLVERKNALAWGVVPTSVAIREQSVATLVTQFEKVTDHLAKQARIDQQTILRQAFITPSCGTGSMAVPDAERVFKLLGETSQALREKYKL
jgi:methionine synthase II (cobalamin-independent)